MDDNKPRSRFDPRVGDEGSEDEAPPPSTRRTARKHVTLSTHPTFEEGQPRTYPNSPDTDSNEKQEVEKPKPSLGEIILDKSPVNLRWIPDSLTWSKIKPAIRCAVVGWVSVVFFIIPQLEEMLGQVSSQFLVFGDFAQPSFRFV